MNYAKLGQTEIEVSRITFGCWELGGGVWEKAADEGNTGEHSGQRHPTDCGGTKSIESSEPEST